MLIFDEASGIPDPIWSVGAGFFTENILDRYWFAFSNPRRNTGYFFECFNGKRNFWRTRNIDARTVEDTDKAVYEQIIEEYGQDSPQARIERAAQHMNEGDYATAVISLGDFSVEHAERLVVLRKERQRRFRDGKLKLWVLLDESALRRPVERERGRLGGFRRSGGRLRFFLFQVDFRLVHGDFRNRFHGDFRTIWYLRLLWIQWWCRRRKWFWWQLCSTI